MWMVVEAYIISYLCVSLPLLWVFPIFLLPCLKSYGYGMAFNSFLSLDGFIHPLFVVWPAGGIFVFSQVLFLLRSTISLLRPNFTLICRNGFLRDSLQPMELNSFVDIVSQDLIFVLSYLIEYNCPLYTIIYWEYHPRKHSRSVGW